MAWEGLKLDRVAKMQGRDARCWMSFDRRMPVAFVHVQKTSGTAIINELVRTLAPKRVLNGFDRSLFGGFTEFEQLAPELRSSIFMDGSALPRDVDFVAAHMALSTLWQQFPSYQYITFLREPSARLLSHWLYWRGQPEDGLQRWGSWADTVRKARLRLAEFLASPDVACQLDNIYIRTLLWPNPLIPADDFISESADSKLLEDAFGRLERFAYCDVIENPKFRGCLGTWLGSVLHYEKANETKPMMRGLQSSLAAELSSATFALIEKCTRLDRVLWRAVAQVQAREEPVDILERRAIVSGIARFGSLLAGQVCVPADCDDGDELSGAIKAQDLTSCPPSQLHPRQMPLSPDMVRYSIIAPSVYNVQCGQTATISVTVYLNDPETIQSELPHPCELSYHIYDIGGEMIVFDGLRSLLNEAVCQNIPRQILVSIRVPDLPGQYRVRIILVQQWIAWFDSRDAHHPADIAITVSD